MNKSLNKLSPKDQIDWLARFVIIHSIIYYEMDRNIISNKMYDEYSKHLATLITLNQDIFKKCYYYYVIYDFDGSTGFDLRSRLTKEDNEYLTHLSNYILHNGTKIKEKGRKK